MVMNVADLLMGMLLGRRYKTVGAKFVTGATVVYDANWKPRKNHGQPNWPGVSRRARRRARGRARAI